jgi:predicted dehydrogenase
LPFQTQSLVRSDALMDEISSFVNAVRHGVDPAVSGEDGKRALEVAVAIGQCIVPAARGTSRAGLRT